MTLGPVLPADTYEDNSGQLSLDDAAEQRPVESVRSPLLGDPPDVGSAG